MLRLSPISLVLVLILAYCLSWITFSNEKVFWYFYTFSAFFLMAASLYFSKVEDDSITIRLSFLGFMFGALAYAGMLGTYLFIDMGPAYLTNSIENFLSHYGPSTIWHYLLLIFIIAPSEELFWRGLIQRQFKKYMRPKYAIILSSLLFGLSFIFTGFWIGILGGFFVGVIFGILYEWKRSITTVVLAHITMLVLLFLVLPLT